MTGEFVSHLSRRPCRKSRAAGRSASPIPRRRSRPASCLSTIRTTTTRYLAVLERVGGAGILVMRASGGSGDAARVLMHVGAGLAGQRIDTEDLQGDMRAAIARVDHVNAGGRVGSLPTPGISPWPTNPTSNASAMRSAPSRPSRRGTELLPNRPSTTICPHRRTIQYRAAADHYLGDSYGWHRNSRRARSGAS